MAFTLVAIPLQEKPESYKALYATVHPNPAARSKVPILEIGEPGEPGYQILVESDVVARYVARRWASQGTALIPDDPGEEGRMDLFVSTYMELLAPTYMELLAAKSDEQCDKQFGKLVLGLRAVDRALTMHRTANCTGPFVLGERFSLAETLTAPFVVRQLLNFKHHRGVDVLLLADMLGATAARGWMEAVCARPSVVHTLPAENSLLALAPYLQPFHEYHVPAVTQAAAVARALSECSAAASAAEAEFASLLASGREVAAAKKRSYSEAATLTSKL